MNVLRLTFKTTSVFPAITIRCPSFKTTTNTKLTNNQDRWRCMIISIHILDEVRLHGVRFTIDVWNSDWEFTSLLFHKVG